jgi:hypothetical protein
MLIQNLALFFTFPNLYYTFRWLACGQIHSPLLRDTVDYGIGLTYRPASICSLTGQYDNPMSKSTLSPQSGTMNLASGLSSPFRLLSLKTQHRLH